MQCFFFAAEAEAFADSMCCSGIINPVPPKEKHKIGEDKLQQKILIEVEGVSRSYTKSSLFCPSGKFIAHFHTSFTMTEQRWPYFPTCVFSSLIG